jgi:hypothetical protein
MDLIGFIHIIATLMGIVAFGIALACSEQIQKLRKEIAELRSKAEPVATMGTTAAVAPPLPETPKLPVDIAPEAPAEAEAPKPTGPAWSPALTEPVTPPSPETNQTPRSNTVLDFLFRNVIGLAGAILALLGLVYLGYLGIFNLGPGGRSGALALVGLTASVGSFLVRGAKGLGALRGWLQAIGGAVLLMAAVGSAGIPGLQWISDGALPGLILVLVAMAANVIMAFLARKPALAALHSLFCFIALATAPANYLILGVSVVLAVVFSLFYLRERAIWQHLSTSALTLAFLVFWQARQGEAVLPIALYLHFGLFLYFWFLFIGPALRRRHSERQIRTAGTVLGVLLLIGPLFLPGSWEQLSPFYGLTTLVLAGTYVFWTRRSTSFLGFLNGALAALAGLATVLGLFATSLDPLAILGLGAVWALACRLLAAKAWLPVKLVIPAALVESAFWVAFLMYLQYLLQTEPESGRLSALYLLYALPGLSFLINRPLRLPPGPIWFPWLFGLVFMVGWNLALGNLANLDDNAVSWGLVAGLIALGFGLFWLESRHWLKGSHIGFGVGMCVVLGIAISQDRVWGVDAASLVALSIFAWGALLVLPPLRAAKTGRVVGLALATAGLAALALFLWSRDLPYLVGPAWLAIGSALWFLQALSGLERPQRVMSLILIALFWVHHLLVVLQSNLVIAIGPFGPLPLVLFTHTAVSALVGLATLVLMARCEPWRTRNLAPVPFLVLLALSLLVEFRSDSLAPAFAVTALLLYGVSVWIGGPWAVLGWGSLCFQFASIVLLMTMSSSLRLAQPGWAVPHWWQSGLAIICQLGYLALRLRRSGLPPERLGADSATSAAQSFRRKWTILLILPPALGIGLFLYWASDGILLNCAWLIEAFTLFAMGLVFKERVLHICSLLSVAAIMANLVFRELARIEDLGKVLFLILTGIILMAMSLLYRRFGTVPNQRRPA